MYEGWKGFVLGKWSNEEVDVRDFIQRNYKPYSGDDSFLEGATSATLKLWDEILELSKQEREAGGVLDADTLICSNITSHAPGYIDQELEKIVGIQTDKPFKRSLQPFGGIKMAEQALALYGYEIDPLIKKVFSKYRKTHNDGVFDVYTPEMRRVRRAHILTGLPDSYGRGRIIGDYRRVALYGVDYLIEQKNHDKDLIDGEMTPEKIRNREEIADQIKALDRLRRMALAYGCDISKPATTAKEAIQAVYFGYLAAIKDQNGAAMSIGRISTFLDIYIERDLENGIITESEAQELIDHLVMKLRIVKFMRIQSYNELFSGDPTWVTESIGGMGVDGRTLVTKTSFRILHTLRNLGPAPEPNLTVLWSKDLPVNFKNYCAQLSIDTSSVQYESDDLMRPEMGDDYAIACCVSAMRVGKDMQFFGARANLAKCLLYALNGGVDEIMLDKETGKPYQVSPVFDKITSDDALDYNEVMQKFDQMSEWLAGVYVNALNIIQKSVDKYIVKSKTVNDTGIELTAEIRVKDEATGFVNRINEVSGVSGVTLVTFNGDYMS